MQLYLCSYIGSATDVLNCANTTRVADWTQIAVAQRMDVDGADHACTISSVGEVLPATQLCMTDTLHDKVPPKPCHRSRSHNRPGGL